MAMPMTATMSAEFVPPSPMFEMHTTDADAYPDPDPGLLNLISNLHSMGGREEDAPLR